MANALLGGPAGLCIAIIAYAAMAWCSFCILGDVPVLGSLGTCLPSANEWGLNPYLSMAICGGTMAVCVLMSVQLNARYSIVPGTGLVYAVTFIVSAGSIPWINRGISSALIMTAVVLICTYLLFALYGRRHAAQGICVIFSLLSWGSMIQYGFVLLMPIFFLGAIFIGAMRFKEFVGALLGIICPYWIMWGLGAVSIEDIGLPILTNLFSGYLAPAPLFYLLLGEGITALAVLLLTASNAMTSSATGQQQRSYNSFLNLLGIAMVWYMLFDFTNILAYTTTLSLCLGWQTARYAANTHHKLAYLPAVLVLPALIAIFILTLL
ncbi:MAG: hypothetical protein NC402_04490 [Prevotella sp.]|nr:hypothetical protein [Prevotella sp.]MCM1075057.1 hypothetical protein [Ruminococcus sp.]